MSSVSLLQSVAPQTASNIQKIHSALQTAAKKTGVSFDYLLTTAKRESALNPKAKAPTSSALGLFQFIDQTWLKTVKTHGGKFGLGHLADQITKTDKGQYLAKSAMKKEILELRKDPQLAALMAGAFTKENAAYLTSVLKRDLTSSDLYLAHFWGAKGAGRFLNHVKENPDLRAADYFPKAAKANRNLFYKNKKPLSFGQVHNLLIKHHAAHSTTKSVIAKNTAAFEPAFSLKPADNRPKAIKGHQNTGGGQNLGGREDSRAYPGQIALKYYQAAGAAGDTILLARRQKVMELFGK